MALNSVFQSEQSNEYFLHHRRSGRGHRGRRLSWGASLKDSSPEASVYTRPAWSDHVHLCSRVWRWRFRQAKVAVVTFALLAGCMAAHAEVASIYGDDLCGHLTASGERFDC
jgi:rare lipoprotein A (peptidoglycan hydrolase)